MRLPTGKRKSRRSPRPDKLAVARSTQQMRRALASARRRGRSIGLVPTLGALHAGHLSLLRTARKECDYVVVSVFVNPTQFSASEDLAHYPRPWKDDLELCRGEKVDLVFAPSEQEMYPPGFCTWVQVSGLGDILEGEYRPGHFRGVATVVLKLLSIVAPDRAYFGKKDYQQLLVVQQMVRDLGLPVRIRACPTVREPDGLACSSRNQYLTPEERQRALVLFRGLSLAHDMVAAGERDASDIRQRVRDAVESTAGCVLDYAELVDPQTLEVVTSLDRPTLAALAVRVGKTRLIDNLLLRP
ncbi:MAG: pantoate--beta-alanine ligase [Planctomycetes bacterium]|nr:pantoate--beta-alanine ligase [Planctomycetota bacterium]